MIPKIMDDTKSLKELVNDKTCIGRLSECSECYVEEERNGAYTLTLSVPITAKYYSKLKLGGILKVKSNQEDDEQLFRIETITEPYGDLVEVLANHISYDLLKTTVKPCSTTGADNACKLIMQNMTGGSAFTISTDFVGTTGKFNNEIPQPARSLFGGQDGSLIDTYGGEWHFDNLNCELLKARGIDRNVQLRYGKNITSIEQEKNIESLYTHIQPYITVEGSDAIVGTLHELTKVSDDNIKIYNLDLTSKFDTTESTPSVEDINKACDTYIKNNDLTTPKVNIKLEYVNLAEVQEYKELFMSEKVALCDTVHIYFPKLDINASAKVISYKYNVLKERYEELEIGDTKSSFVGSIVEISEDSKSYADNATKKLFNEVNKELDDVNNAITDLNKEVNSIVTDGIVTEAEKASVRKMLQIVEKEKGEADTTYNDLIANTNLKGTAKTNLTNAYNEAFGNNGAYTSLINAINAILSASTAEEINKALETYNTAYENYSSKVETYQLRIAQAQISISSVSIQSSIDTAIDKIKAGSGGNVALHDSKDDTNDIVRNEIYAYDGDTIATSNNVLRINNQGIAGTDEGVNGNYHIAITVDGHINGEWISANTIQSSSFADDVRAKIEMAVTYDEAKNDVISWINASADNIILNTKKLIFGVYPDGQYIEVSNYYENNVATGVQFEGTGFININAEKTITISNEIDDFSWNRIYMYANENGYTNNRIHLYNYQSTKQLANWFRLSSESFYSSNMSNANVTSLCNYHVDGDGKFGNSFTMLSNNSEPNLGQSIYMDNYNNNGTQGNSISMWCGDTRNYIYITNRDQDGKEIAYLNLDQTGASLSFNKQNGNGTISTVMVYLSSDRVTILSAGTIRLYGDGGLYYNNSKIAS